jgi:hypothetical protein
MKNQKFHDEETREAKQNQNFTMKNLVFKFCLYHLIKIQKMMPVVHLSARFMPSTKR